MVCDQKQLQSASQSSCRECLTKIPMTLCTHTVKKCFYFYRTEHKSLWSNRTVQKSLFSYHTVHKRKVVQLRPEEKRIVSNARCGLHYAVVHASTSRFTTMYILYVLYVHCTVLKPVLGGGGGTLRLVIFWKILYTVMTFMTKWRGWEPD